MAKPALFVIQRSHFPEGIALEECERHEKINGEEAIVRFQRKADINVFQRIGRFFSDLVGGVTRAQGYLCNLPKLPQIVNIRGQWFQMPKANQGTESSLLATSISGGKLLFQRIRVEVQDRIDETVWDSTIAHRISDELHDRFVASQILKNKDQDIDTSPVKALLDWQEHRPTNLNEAQLKRLSAFKEAFTDFSSDLGEQVRYRVKVALDQLGKQIDNNETLRVLADRAGWYGPPPPPAPAAPPPPPIIKPMSPPTTSAAVRAKGTKANKAAPDGATAQSALMAQLAERVKGRRPHISDSEKHEKSIDDQDWS